MVPLLSLFSCSTKSEIKNETNNNTTLKYAKRFQIKKFTDYTVLELLGNRNNKTITASFVLYLNQKPTYSKEAYYIKIPITTVACMSSIYAAMLSKMNVQKTIVAIDNVDYYTNSYIQSRVKEGIVKELAKGPTIEVEKMLALNPELLLTFGMGNPAADVDKKLITAGIPVAVSLDHLEETPLGRAEWIKFFACFFNKEKLADSLFAITEKKYTALTSLTKTITNLPTVLTEIKYGDAWYVPSGKSYIANLLKDAGADYFWKNENQAGSLPLSFEAVYAKAKDCDVWLNVYNINSQKELLSYDERYSLFNAYKKNRIYNNNKTQNKKGYCNYWETGITNPDEVLADVIFILHPSILLNHKLLYYKQIN